MKDFLKMTNEEVMKKNGGERFSIALGNPPYSKGLHLQFLEKTIEISDKVVFVEPGEFILRPYIKSSWQKTKEKYKESIGSHIKEIEVLKNASTLFGAGIDEEILIYVCDKDGGFDYDNYYKQYDKKYQDNLNRFKTSYTLKDKIEKYKDQKYFVPIRTDGIFERWWTLQLINYLDIIVDGKVYSGDYKGLTIPEARNKNPHENPRNNNRDTLGIAFDTLEEAVNFRDSVKLEAYLYIIALLKTTRGNPLDKLPLFDSYKERWTNEKIFDLFDINKDIRNKIIELMQPFMKQSRNFGDTLVKTKEKLKKL